MHSKKAVSGVILHRLEHLFHIMNAQLPAGVLLERVELARRDLALDRIRPGMEGVHVLHERPRDRGR